MKQRFLRHWTSDNETQKTNVVIPYCFESPAHGARSGEHKWKFGECLELRRQSCESGSLEFTE